ncbi:hypothetical protein FD755_005459, partial [Muntiacus reevesi]
QFCHIFGKLASKNCYDSVPTTHSAPDNHFCAVNPHFIAVVTECTGGGAFLVCRHRGNVLDVKWNPFNDFELASCSEDAMIKIWDIPKQLLTKNLTAFRKELVGHARRVGLVEWHPTAANILFSSSYDYKVMIWNLDSKESVITSPVKTINCHQDVILSMKPIARHRANKALFLGNLQKLLPTGTSRGSNRQMVDLDGPSGVLFPFYDADTNMLSMCLNHPMEHRSYNPQQGVGIFRFYKLITTKCLIAPGSMIVPQQSGSYQEDIYLPTASAQLSLTAQKPLSVPTVPTSSLQPDRKAGCRGWRRPFSLLEEKAPRWAAEHRLEKKTWLTDSPDNFECRPPKAENELLWKLVTQDKVQAKQVELEIRHLWMSSQRLCPPHPQGQQSAPGGGPEPNHRSSDNTHCFYIYIYIYFFFLLEMKLLVTGRFQWDLLPIFHLPS